MSLQTDALKRQVAYGRAPKGQPVNLACVSCHDAGRGGIDATSMPGHVSVGAGWADTNGLSSINAAYYTLQFWNGRADSLWAQAAAAVEGALMNGDRLAVAWTLATHYGDRYREVFGAQHPMPITGARAAVEAQVEPEGARVGQCKLVTAGSGCPTGCRAVNEGGATACWPMFPLHGKPGGKPGCQPGDPAEPFGDAFDCLPAEAQTAITRVLVNFGKAIAAYEQRLVSGPAPFDRWVADVKAGRGATSRALSAAARLGARLFVGKAACTDCHNTPLFSDNRFHNVGVAQVGPGVPTVADCGEGGTCDCSAGDGKNCLPWGARDGLGKLRKNPMRRDSHWSDQRGDDSRRHFLEMPLDEIAKGAWRTPSLRGVALTAPYMHDGALATLEDVIRHYDIGGSPEAPGTPSARLKPLHLTAQERAALVEFMKALTGEPPPAELTATPPLPQ